MPIWSVVTDHLLVVTVERRIVTVQRHVMSIELEGKKSRMVDIYGTNSRIYQILEPWHGLEEG